MLTALEILVLTLIMCECAFYTINVYKYTIFEHLRLVYILQFCLEFYQK